MIKEFEDNDFIKADYDIIKPIVSKEIESVVERKKYLKSKTYKRYIMIKRFKFSMYTLLIAFVSVFTTLVATKQVYIGLSSPGLMERGKIDLVTPSVLDNQDSKFDKVIAFGPEGLMDGFTIDTILNSNLLNENDKSILREYKKERKLANISYKGRFQIFLGLKDNIEYVYMIDYLPMKAIYYTPMGSIIKSISYVDEIYDFTFESNLPYSLESIVNDFENIMNKEIDDDFLNSAEYFAKEEGNILSSVLVSGIILDFNLNSDNTFQAYYKIIDDGDLVVVNK